jgi:transposase
MSDYTPSSTALLSDETPVPVPAGPVRFMGLDIHKEYLVATAVNADLEVVYGPRRVENPRLEAWIARTLTPFDAVVLEMTTNTYQVYDALVDKAYSVLVVHPPHVALITRAQVKTDRKAALTLAQLHATGLLTGVWMPPPEVRALRALLTHRHKLTKLASIAKNRLHNALHRHHIVPPDGYVFATKNRAWWEQLTLPLAEKSILLSDLATLDFAQSQIQLLEIELGKIAVQDAHVPRLVQLPGIGMLNALTILAAIGDITRFPDSDQLVGYAGLGARVHDSGHLHTTGRITKSGRKDLRWAMVQAARHARTCHPKWKREFERLEPRLGKNKATVALARKLLVVVWHILTKAAADRFAQPQQVANSFFALAHRIRARNLPNGLSALEFTRQQLDQLGLGQEVTHIPWGSKTFKLPPSKLK